MEAGWSGRLGGSLAEIGIWLILYAKNSLGKRANKAECTYVISAWQGIWERVPMFTHTDIREVQIQCECEYELTPRVAQHSKLYSYCNFLC